MKTNISLPQNRTKLISFILRQRGVFSRAHIVSRAAKFGLRIPPSLADDTLNRLELAGYLKRRNGGFTVA